MPKCPFIDIAPDGNGGIIACCIGLGGEQEWQRHTQQAKGKSQARASHRRTSVAICAGEGVPYSLLQLALLVRPMAIIGG